MPASKSAVPRGWIGGGSKTADPWKQFERYLDKEGLRATEERRVVLDVIVSRKGHFDAEELQQFLRRRRKPVSRATLYRTLDHLILAGLVKKHSFGRGHSQYEYVYGRKHHDHMVCDRCGRVIEFVNDRIESLQDQVCREHGFRATNHVMEIFGVCSECARADE
jgi:Fur family ferric uptake transcriptional regulator